MNSMHYVDRTILKQDIPSSKSAEYDLTYTLRDGLKMINNMNDFTLVLKHFYLDLTVENKDSENSKDINIAEITDLLHGAIQEMLALPYKQTTHELILINTCLEDNYDFDTCSLYRGKIFPLTMIDWGDLIDARIDNEAIIKYGLCRCLESFLFDMTILGYNYETHKKELKHLLKDIRKQAEKGEIDIDIDLLENKKTIVLN